MVALKWSMKNLYGIEPGEVFWAASDVGWVVGHSYIVYAPLLHGATTIMYEGKPVGTPDAGAFWRVIAEHKVGGACSPRRPRSAPSRRKTRTASCIGEIRSVEVPHAVPRRRARRSADGRVGRGAISKVPVIDHWWQTETGWASPAIRWASACCRSSTARRRCRCRATTCRCVDESGQAGAGRHDGLDRRSSCRCRRRCLPTLWQQRRALHARAISTNFPAITRPPMPAIKDEDGYVYVMGRTDDIINVAGHRLSTGGMEEVLAAHPDVAECAVHRHRGCAEGRGAAAASSC